MEALKNYTVTMRKGTSTHPETIREWGSMTSSNALKDFHELMLDFISDYDHSEYINDDSPALPDYYRGAGWYHEDGAQIMLDGEEYTAVEFGDARYELVEKTIYDLMNEFPSDIQDGRSINIDFHELILDAIDAQRACLIWLCADVRNYDWGTYDNDDEAISAALDLGLPCFIIPADPHNYLSVVGKNSTGKYCITGDEEDARGLENEEYDTPFDAISAYMEGDKDWVWTEEIMLIGCFWTRHSETTHPYKLTEASSCPDEPGVLFSGNPLRKDWDSDAQDAADMLADFIAQSSIYDATERPNLLVNGFKIYDGDDLTCRIVEIDWDDIHAYAGRFSYDIDLYLSPSDMATLGFTEFESGKWNDPVVIHFRDYQAWAETTTGNLCYEDIDSASLLDSLKESLPIENYQSSLRIV